MGWRISSKSPFSVQDLTHEVTGEKKNLQGLSSTEQL